MRKWAVIVVIIAAVAGGVLSGIAAGHYFSFLRGGLDQPSFCNLGERLNCDVVTASSYATITGLPVAGLGLLYFLVQGLFGAWIAFAPIGADRRSTAAIGALIGSLALIYPAYLAAIMAAKLHTWCLTCLGIDLAALLVAIGWWVALRCAVNERWRLVRRRIGPHAALFLVVMGIGAIFLASATQAAQTVGKRPRLTKGEISRAVALFQRGSPFDLASLPEGRPFWGNPNAKATVIEFSDFQCPFCKEAATTLKTALAEFRDDVRIVFLHYPLDATCNSAIERSFHTVACLAARAATCAHSDGRFWEYHDALFRNQQKLSAEIMPSLAKQIGLDEQRFAQCIGDPSTDATVKADVAMGQHVHLTGTPTILINNRQVQNWRSRELLRAIIRAELAR